MEASKRLQKVARHLGAQGVAAESSSAEDILAAHYAANPHVAAQLKSDSPLQSTAAPEEPSALPASTASADDILAAHYAANPHVASQLKVGDSAAEPEAVEPAAAAPSGTTADDILAQHYAANPHVAAQLKVGDGPESDAAAPAAAATGSADDILAAHYAANPHVASQLKASDGVSAAAAPARRTQETIVTGTGEFTFEYVPELLQLPAEVDIQHAHSLCTDSAGRIYLTYTSNSVGATTHAVARFSPDGGQCEILGQSTADPLAEGTPHGIRHSVEDGVEYLYHANNGMMTKSTIDGDVIWSNPRPLVWPGMPYAPTDCLVIPGDDRLFVADGYGSSFVHVADRRDGSYTGTSWGGKGNTASTAEPTRFDCNHGMGYDASRGRLVFTDRANHRLVFTDDSGAFVAETPLGEGGLAAPCNVDVSGDFAITASLGNTDGMQNGECGIVDLRSNTVVSVMEIAKLLGPGSAEAAALGGDGHKHPHDAIFLPNGDVVVGTWNPGHLSYWRRV